MRRNVVVSGPGKFARVQIVQGLPFRTANFVRHLVLPLRHDVLASAAIDVLVVHRSGVGNGLVLKAILEPRSLGKAHILVRREFGEHVVGADLGPYFVHSGSRDITAFFGKVVALGVPDAYGLSSVEVREATGILFRNDARLGRVLSGFVNFLVFGLPSIVVHQFRDGGLLF